MRGLYTRRWRAIIVVERLWMSVKKMNGNDELIEKLIPRLLPLGMSIEKDTKGRPIVKYKRIIFDIF